jgi:hypothetical protein
VLRCKDTFRYIHLSLVLRQSLYSENDQQGDMENGEKERVIEKKNKQKFTDVAGSSASKPLTAAHSFLPLGHSPKKNPWYPLGRWTL